MYEFRQIIQRLRMGESQREIARTQRVGRRTVVSIHEVAGTRGWLDPAAPMPDDATLSACFNLTRTTPQNVSSVEAFREEILAWHAQGIQATTMRQALARKHGYTGSVYAIYRFLKRRIKEG